MAWVSAAMIWPSTRSSGSVGWISRPMSTVQPAERAPAGLGGDAEPQVGVALEAHRPAEPGDGRRRGAAALGQLDDGGPGRRRRVAEHLLGDPLQRAGELRQPGADPRQHPVRRRRPSAAPPVDRVGVDHRGPRGGVHLVINHGTPPFGKEC